MEVDDDEDLSSDDEDGEERPERGDEECADAFDHKRDPGRGRRLLGPDAGFGVEADGAGMEVGAVGACGVLGVDGAGGFVLFGERLAVLVLHAHRAYHT